MYWKSKNNIHIFLKIVKDHQFLDMEISEDYTIKELLEKCHISYIPGDTMVVEYRSGTSLNLDLSFSHLHVKDGMTLVVF